MTAVPAAPSGLLNGSSNGITEDEAALYDRQIRLWGVEAQNRMRSASVLVVTLRGIATEVCKNTVLAGIGKLTILDDADVCEEDLGCGFFFREEDVGSKRVVSARPRINALNPRVHIESQSDMQLLDNEESLAQFDLVLLTDSDRDTVVRVNDLCRKRNVKFYASSSYGLHGYIFADLLSHEWIIEQTQKAPDHRSAETSSSAEAIKVSIKKNQSYVPFSRALQHTWAGTGSRKLKKLTPVVYAILVVWEYQSRNSGALPSEEDRASILRSIANEVLPKHGLDPKLLPQDLLQQFALTASMEFMPVCAIIGGLLGQDALNTLGGREAPITNLFTFDGSTSAGDFHRLSIDAE